MRKLKKLLLVLRQWFTVSSLTRTGSWRAFPLLTMLSFTPMFWRSRPCKVATMSSCLPYSTNNMQVCRYSYIQETLCDCLQVHDIVSHSVIRQNCRSSHNTLYLHQPTLPPRGGQGPAPDANTNLLPPLNLRISKSVFIASPKDHTYQNQNNLPLPSHENHPSINKDSLSCVRVLYIGEKKC